MKVQLKISIMLTVFAISFLLIAASYVQKDLKNLNQLEGRWKMDTKKGTLYEEWVILSARELRGKSFKVAGKDTIHLESVQVIAKENAIYYIPTVAGQNNNEPVSFKLIAQSDTQFTFENALHDFPQRIIYTFITSDSLVARIEGLKNGVMKKSNFYYKRDQK